METVRQKVMFGHDSLVNIGREKIEPVYTMKIMSEKCGKMLLTAFPPVDFRSSVYSLIRRIDLVL